jgi:hypothetical protein
MRVQHIYRLSLEVYITLPQDTPIKYFESAIRNTLIAVLWELQNLLLHDYPFLSLRLIIFIMVLFPGMKLHYYVIQDLKYFMCQNAVMYISKVHKGIFYTFFHIFFIDLSVKTYYLHTVFQS